MDEEFDSIGDGIKRFQRMLFIDDIERGNINVIPLTPDEFEEIFGEIEYDDFVILTKTVLREINMVYRWDDFTRMEMMEKWGKWLSFLLEKNEEYEYYEKCAVIHKALLQIEKG